MKACLFAALTAFLTAIDLRCKSKVEEEFSLKEERDIANGRVQLRRVHNKGFAFEKCSEKPEKVRVVSVWICGLLGIVSLVVWLKENCILKKIGLSLGMAGALSNTYDRIVRRYVVDYFGFKTKWEKFSKLTFNLGDMFLLVGSVLWLIGEIIFQKK